MTKDYQEDKTILDACCGGRMFWFDKKQPDTLFVDRRVDEPHVVGKGRHARIRSCVPDEVMDFRNLDLPDNQFSLVVFDPPHLNSLGEKSHTEAVYGKLDPITWRDDLRKGFAECFRVLKPNGVLVFKWNEYDIPLKDILSLVTYNPLFGHKSGKSQLTHWVTFMKLESALKDQGTITFHEALLSHWRLGYDAKPDYQGVL